MNGCACCLLECDMDVRVLHMSITKENTYFVDILVSLKESNEIGNASIMHTDGNEFLGKFKTPNAKMYLSHPWKSYISHVGQDYEGGADEFRLKLYASMLLRWHKRITASCIKKDIEGCPWRVQASICSANGHFVNQTLND
ncbi:hypothetical protein D8674_019380 [Pyrus ussuriensis x Pyrus communis]|uniref:Transposase MuDR plant domain-containing protein n=1 Tax=Pyrus ussuriensis x Pyrus communis TaxID=2448454 RepID=A0A5N5G7V4_9ROSA|nr:hypothetical protein D8674_019380 [Pyrus ussuriensis x Pyrus communis]